ncbi:MAG: diaminopimelate epimerase [Kordia sp.]|nr:MAG: diaminopimelate epimerase [Kordia sp.]
MLTFYKYQGTGNDFVMVDNRQLVISKDNQSLINSLCDRRFGVGGDGFILLENSTTTDFKMVYFNADGNESTMCGNGGRCIVAFAKFLKIIGDSATFEAIDGLHTATISGDVVSLQMQDVTTIEEKKGSVFLDTGSPHHVQFEEHIADFDIKTIGKNIRNEVYGTEGSNVNFVKKINDAMYRLRTYERGVEDETLACGTGATAVAIAMNYLRDTTASDIKINVEGGDLQVSFDIKDGSYTNVFLTGKAVQVFKGEIAC